MAALICSVKTWSRCSAIDCLGSSDVLRSELMFEFNFGDLMDFQAQMEELPGHAVDVQVQESSGETSQLSVSFLEVNPGASESLWAMRGL